MEKFRDLAEPALGVAGVRRVAELVDRLDEPSSLEPLVAALPSVKR